LTDRKEIASFVVHVWKARTVYFQENSFNGSREREPIGHINLQLNFL